MTGAPHLRLIRLSEPDLLAAFRAAAGEGCRPPRGRLVRRLLAVLGLRRQKPPAVACIEPALPVPGSKVVSLSVERARRGPAVLFIMPNFITERGPRLVQPDDAR